jgi:hypothetical protein
MRESRLVVVCQSAPCGVWFALLCGVSRLVGRGQSPTHMGVCHV